MSDPIIIASKHDENVYYRVRLSFKHDVRYKRAGETCYLWRFSEMHAPDYCFWQMCDDAAFAYRFATLKEAREAAAHPDVADYGGDKCCERIVEKVTETVERHVRVKAPKKKLQPKRTKKKSCGDCKDMRKVYR